MSTQSGTSRRRLTHRAWAIIGVTAVVLFGCSGTTQSTSPSTSGSQGSGPQSTSTDAASTSSATFCDAARRSQSAGQALSQAEKDALGHSGPSSIAVSAARDEQAAFTDMQHLAPAAIQGDVSMISTTYEPFFEAIIANGGDMNKTLSAQNAIQATVAGLAFQTASTALSNYENQSCGISESGR